ncbi:MAG: hypothetical protein KDD51_08545 [Bdellovibrionales bacterium]|nr:hypothetical protein [Bdellovibrionales bacterium]
MKCFFWQVLYRIVALPFGIFLTVVNFLLSLTTTYDTEGSVDIPENAILFSSHTDVYGLCLHPAVRTGGRFNTVWLGYHGIAPYIFAVWDHFCGLEYWCYWRQGTTSKREQVIEFMKHHPSIRLGLATDSGGPYGKVRPSLIELSQKTGRPLVAVRMRMSRSITFLKHHLPLPFGKIVAQVSSPISREALDLEVLQAHLDNPLR